MTARQELESFTQFALARVTEASADASLDELFDSWRAENPSEASQAEDLAAVRAALEDYRAGDRGRPA